MARPDVLAACERDAGILDQRLEVARIARRDGDAEAGLEVEGVAVNVEIGLEAAHDPAQHRGRARPSRAARRSSRRTRRPTSRATAVSKTPPPARAARLAPILEHQAEPVRHLAQHEIALVGAERVVDALEAVEVDDDQRGALVVPVIASMAAVDPQLELLAIGQAGELVDEGQRAEFTASSSVRPTNRGSEPRTRLMPGLGNMRSFSKSRGSSFCSR